MQLGQRLDVVEREQPAVGYHHQAADVRVARQHLLERGLQRWGLGRVAVEDLVEDRHAIGHLHHAQHELAGDHALFGHTEVTHIAVLLAKARGADGGQVVEDHR